MNANIMKTKDFSFTKYGFKVHLSLHKKSLNPFFKSHIINTFNTNYDWVIQI